jgi:hypothetical protein
VLQLPACLPPHCKLACPCSNKHKLYALRRMSTCLQAPCVPC